MSRDIVQEQYENWVYPSPVDDLSTSPLREQLDPSCWATHFAYWPRCADWRGKDLLVAGCGANQAASIAFHNRQCRVTGVDVSANSLAHEAYLKGKHGLDNLELIQMPLEDVTKLGQRFDLVICVGVLHHLKSPEAGLRALRECLRVDGSMGLMVYGKYARAGIYVLQDLFRRMGLKQTAGDVAVVKEVLSRLPTHHLAATYVRTAPDLQADTGIVDTFLHQRDVAYTVGDCLELLEKSRLVFQSWSPSQSQFYYPNMYVGTDHPLYQWTMHQPDREIWQAMELFSCSIGIHCMIACRDDRPASDYRIEVVPANFDRLMPAWTGDYLSKEGGKGSLRREGFPEIALEDWQSALALQFDGTRSIEACLETQRVTDRSGAANFLESLRRLGYLVFGLK